MQIATVLLKLGTSDVEKYNVTPAEALVYMVEHRRQGTPIRSISDVREVERTDGEEMKRLNQKFGKKVKAVFPGPLARVPHTFQELKEADLEGMTIPGSKNLTGVEVPPEAIKPVDLPIPGSDEE